MLKRYHASTDGARRFELLPAIDLRGGRVVRLRGGDFARETAYSEDPVAVARAFAGAGAPWLHVVDLDGAREGAPVQRDTVRAIIAAVGDQLNVEAAGGIRTLPAVAGALEWGAARIVVGTAALRVNGFARDLVERHGADRIAVALDVRDGAVVGDAWRQGGTTEPVEDALRRLADDGVRTFEVTAIDRDGSLEGPDLDLLASLVAVRAGEVIASAGIASLDDLRRVREIGCAGAIVGRAIYEGRIDLASALQAVAGGEDRPAGLDAQ